MVSMSSVKTTFISGHLNILDFSNLLSFIFKLNQIGLQHWSAAFECNIVVQNWSATLECNLKLENLGSDKTIVIFDE